MLKKSIFHEIFHFLLKHNVHIVIHYLQQTYSNKWFGTHSTTPWLVRSPDLNPLTFFLWGYLKDKVHSRPFVFVEDLKEHIKLHLNINYDQLNSVMKNVKKRCIKCV